MLKRQQIAKLEELAYALQQARCNKELEDIRKQIVVVATTPLRPENDEEWAEYLGITVAQFLGVDEFAPTIPNLPCGQDDAVGDKIDATKSMIRWRMEWAVLPVEDPGTGESFYKIADGIPFGSFKCFIEYRSSTH